MRDDFGEAMSPHLILDELARLGRLKRELAAHLPDLDLPHSVFQSIADRFTRLKARLCDGKIKTLTSLIVAPASTYPQMESACRGLRQACGELTSLADAWEPTAFGEHALRAGAAADRICDALRLSGLRRALGTDGLPNC
jgi:hypothetical protein